MRTDLEADVLILLYDVARHMRTHADQMARDHGLTRAQWIILVRLVDRLEALGLVKRRTDPDDRRIWRLRLTPAAAPVLRDVTRCRKRLYDIMTRDIRRADLRAMQDGLRKMKANIASTRGFGGVSH
jgi:DNA-binding MarR family transcriptional regulator